MEMTDLLGMPAHGTQELESLLARGTRAVMDEFAVHKEDYENLKEAYKGLDELCKNDHCFRGDQATRERILEEPHVLALRLYTSSSFWRINVPLHKKIRPHPYRVTAYYINQALCKMQDAAEVDSTHQTPEETLWRGITGTTVTKDFIESGGTVFAPISTSSELDVIMRDQQDTCDGSFVFQIKCSNFSDRGVNVSWVSMSEKPEHEHVYPPFTFFKPHNTEPLRKTEDGKATVVTVIPCRRQGRL
jgi:hypothetical protein